MGNNDAAGSDVELEAEVVVPLLAIDAGNSKTTLAIFHGDQMAWRESISTRQVNFSSIIELVRGYVGDDPVPGWRAYIASVRPSINDDLAAALDELGFADPCFISPRRHEIIKHDLETPQTTGVDRLLAALGAFSIERVNPKKEAVIVVQAGTAITVDVVGSDGVYRGGVIMPGPGMWLSCLADAAEQLPVIHPSAIDWEKRGPARSTRDALLNGVVSGLVGAVKETVRISLMSIKTEVPIIVFTGGWAENLLEYFPCIYEPDLVLRGIEFFSRRVR